MRPVAVWDLPVRVFHWLLAAAVLVNYVTGELSGIFFVIHVVAGYVIAALLLCRLIWGWIGSAHARFADFVRGSDAVRQHARAVLRLRPPRFVGHNPIGGWMVILLMVILALTVATGLIAGDDDGNRGPLASYAGGMASTFAGLHGFLANTVVLLAVIHVTGVLVDWLLTGDNLIRAMITGDKHLEESEAAAEPPLAPRWLGALMALLVAGLTATALSATDFAALNASGGHHDDTSERD